ncbi:MAG: UbiA-like polyprenyltransferase [Planctomycetota bacterium]
MASLRTYLSLVKFSHSVFALPFAIMALLVATDGRPSPRLLALIVLAMVCARTAAMAYNRLVDRDVDVLNPRTRGREIPSGVVRPAAARLLVVLASAGFVISAGFLSRLCLYLSLPVLAVLLGYSHAKRFTSLSHAWLGLALGLAPPAAWLAATGRFDMQLLPACWLGLGVVAWVMGFDMLYACQDAAFDRAHGLRSLPARVGVARTLIASRCLHVVAVALFALFGWKAGLGAVYQVGVALAALFLGYEHRLLRADDLSRMNSAFFTMNGLVGLALLSATVLAVYV